MISIAQLCAVCAAAVLAACATPSNGQTVVSAIDATGKARLILPLLGLASESARNDPLLTQLRFGGILRGKAGGELVSLELHLPIATEWNGLHETQDSKTVDAWVSPIWLGADHAQCEALLRQLAQLLKQKTAPATRYKCSGRAIAIAYTKTDPARLSSAPVELLVRFDSAEPAKHALINVTIDLPRKRLIIQELNTDNVNRLAFLNGFAREGM